MRPGLSWPAGAFVACLSLASAAPGDPATSLDRATVLLAQGRLDQALAEVRRAGPAFTDAGDAQRSDLLEGLILHRLKRDAEAVPALERALTRDPGEFDGRIDLGQALQASGRWDLAQAQFKEAQRRSPQSAEPWLGLGAIAAGQGQAAEALRCFRRAADLDPQRESAWLGLSDALVAQGQLRQAAMAREKALALCPGDADLWFKQAVAWYGLGELDRSEKALSQASLGDSPEAFFLEGCLQYKRGHPDLAERDFLAAIAPKGGTVQARLNLGISYYSQGRYEEALAQFDQLLQEGDAPEAAAYRAEAAAAASDRYFHLGTQALMAGDLLGAIEPLQKALALAVGKDAEDLQRLIARIRQQEGPQAASLDRRARQALKEGDLPQAVLLWQDALRVDPAQAGALKGLEEVQGDLVALKLAYAQAALAADLAEDRAGAEGLAHRLEALDSAAGSVLRKRLESGRRSRSETLLAAGVAALESGHPREALSQFDRALAMDPGDPRVLEREKQAKAAQRSEVGGLLAQALEAEAQGRWQPAYQSMQHALAVDPDDLEARQGVRRLAKRLDLKRQGEVQADDLYYQGVYAYGAGDTLKALELWHAGLRLDPGHGPLQEAVRSADAKLKALASLGRT